MNKKFMVDLLTQLVSFLSDNGYDEKIFGGRDLATVRKLDKLLTAEVNAINDLAADAGVDTEIDVGKLCYSDKWGFVRYTFTRTAPVKKIRALADDIEVLLNDMRAEYEVPPESRIEVAFGAGLSFDVPFPMEYTPADWSDGQKRLAALSPFQALVGIDYSMAPTRPVILDFTRGLAHAMITGSTGSGKTTVALNLLLSLAYSTSPDRAHFLFVSTKVGPEHMAIARLPHVSLHRTARECVDAIATVSAENDRREFAPDKRKVFLIIDEYVNLQRQVRGGVLTGAISKVEEELMDIHTGSIAEAGRSRGVHIVAITQKAVVEVVDTIFKSNMPTRIGCKTMNKEEDRVAMGDVEAPCHSLSERGSFYVTLNGERPALARCFNISAEQLDEAVAAIDDMWHGVTPYRIEIATYDEAPAEAKRYVTEDDSNADKILEHYSADQLALNEKGKPKGVTQKELIKFLYGDDADSTNQTYRRKLEAVLKIVTKKLLSVAQ